jgi:hypothetical protein
MAANERSSLLSSPPHTPVFMTLATFNSPPAQKTERTTESDAYEAPLVPPPPPPLPRPPAVAPGQFPVSQRSFEKRSVMLDVDITFVATTQTMYDLPPPRKLRLQISPGDCVFKLSPLIRRRVQIPPPFAFAAFVAKTSQGYELEDTDPVGEVADRGDSLRACAGPRCRRTLCHPLTPTRASLQASSSTFNRLRRAAAAAPLRR